MDLHKASTIQSLKEATKHPKSLGNFPSSFLPFPLVFPERVTTYTDTRPLCTSHHPYHRGNRKRASFPEPLREMANPQPNLIWGKKLSSIKTSWASSVERLEQTNKHFTCHAIIGAQLAGIPSPIPPRLLPHPKSVTMSLSNCIPKLSQLWR